MLTSDDALVAECGAQVLARAGAHMALAADRGQQQLPDSIADALQRMAAEGSPAAAKASVRALAALLGPETAAGRLSGLCNTLLDALKRPSSLAAHARLLGPAKALSMVGRQLPALFAPHAAELADFVLNQLLVEDLSR